jgi:SAM-dependent methyltransferase
MEQYSIYGHFYDITQGDHDGHQYLHLLRKHHPKARSLLELACGTGTYLLPLSKHYDVSGLDISSTMLKYARKKLPGIKFSCQNMAEFKLNQKFDAIICPYDSINHLLKFSDWRQTFRAAKRHLNEKGVFIFDINTEYKLRKFSAAPAYTRSFGDNYMIMQIIDSGNGVTDWNIKIFEHQRNKTYRLHHEIIKERSFAHDRVMAALRLYYDEVRSYDIQKWSRPKKTSGRLFYVCRSKSS